MKLSKREIAMLTVLGIVLAGFAYIRFVYMPETDRIKKLEAQYSESLKLYERAKAGLERSETLTGEIFKLDKEIEAKKKMISDTLRVPFLLEELDEVAQSSNVRVDGITFLGEAAAIKGSYSQTGQYSAVEEQIKAVADSISDTHQSGLKSVADEEPKPTAVTAGNEPILRSLSINFNFSGSVSNCLNFISYYEKHERSFVINELNIHTSGEECTGKISIAAYDLGEDEEGFEYRQ